MSPATDPIVALVERMESDALRTLGIAADDAHSRGNLRRELLDAVSSQLRAKRLAELLNRVPRDTKP